MLYCRCGVNSGSPRMILDKLKAVRKSIAAAAIKADRKPEEVELLAVTKYASVEAVAELLSGNIRQIGESRIQDALKKHKALGDNGHKVRWRFIGHLQRNKVRQALDIFDTVDSLDSIKLASALQNELEKRDKTLSVLCQVKLTDKESQSGVAPGELEGFLKEIKKFPNLRPEGLMAIAPMMEDVEETRPFFRKLKILFDTHFPQPYREGQGPYLSMGMSRDYEIAIEEGANLVRVGSALFAEG